MAEEKNLYKQLKNNTKSVIWTRIETSTGLGVPDLFGFYRRGFWLELKQIINNKLNFSAHQIAWIHLCYGWPVTSPTTVEAHRLLSGVARWTDKTKPALRGEDMRTPFEHYCTHILLYYQYDMCKRCKIENKPQ